MSLISVLRQRRPVLVPGFLALALAGCAGVPASPDGWHAVPLPGKAPTQYRAEFKDGQAVIAATARRSASLWRRHLNRAAGDFGAVEFSWWVSGPIAGADIADAGREDAAARVLFAFDGDHQRLSPRERMAFELAEVLTGERPPFATLMYVFANETPEGSLVHNPRSQRIRKIVLDSGPSRQQLWRRHRRDLVADFRLAFGEEPGRLLSVALMTDTDNTGTEAKTWYGPLHFE